MAKKPNQPTNSHSNPLGIAERLLGNLKGTTMETPQQNTKREICTITFISDESQHIDVIVTSHPNGNDLEKLAKSVLEALQALMQRNAPPNVKITGPAQEVNDEHK